MQGIWRYLEHERAKSAPWSELRPNPRGKSHRSIVRNRLRSAPSSIERNPPHREAVCCRQDPTVAGVHQSSRVIGSGEHQWPWHHAPLDGEVWEAVHKFARAGPLVSPEEGGSVVIDTCVADKHGTRLPWNLNFKFCPRLRQIRSGKPTSPDAQRQI